MAAHRRPRRPCQGAEPTHELGRRRRAKGQSELLGPWAERSSGKADRDPETQLDELSDEVPEERAALPAGVQPGPGPAAIVGVACRLPAAADPSSFWDLLAEGRNATREVPRHRSGAWAKVDRDRSARGTVNTSRAAFLERVDLFDAPFFRISPREARQTDPQQRLGLELAWEALEDAGILPETLFGTRTGVFVGGVWQDYGDLARQDVARLTHHSGVGQDIALMAGRISYVLGTHGPSLTVNTAFSSSLVALHLAVQSVRSGESQMALVGGVSLMVSPATTVALARFGGLAPDGLSKAFSAGADGFGRGEGGVFLVVKPLADAVRDGDRVYAVVRGSAVNSDGASDGIAAPNPAAQEALLRQAYEAAAVPAHAVDYVEAHGTGTALGDPVEARALGAALGKARPPGRPLRIGSVKSNVGHTEGAAGLTGLLKVVLSMRRRVLPRSLYAEELNPDVAWDELGLRVCQTAEAWPRERHEPLVAGVSSFGWSGTNAHAVLERPPSGHVALHLLEEPSAEELGDRVRELCGEDVAGGLAEDPSPWRVALLKDEDQAGPWELVAPPRQVTAELSRRPKVAFVCPPPSGRWPGMAVDLLLSEPVFRRRFLACDRAFEAQLGGVSLLRCLLEGERYEARVAGPDREQPLLFAVQVSLAALLESLGVVPDAVVGEGLGEVAAANVAGTISLAEAARALAQGSGPGSVRFREAVERLDATGPHVFVELCGDPVLVRSLDETPEAAGNGSFGIAALRRGMFGPAEVRRCVGRLYTAGARVARKKTLFEGALPLLLSGRTPAALAEQAARWSAWLAAHPDASWGDVVRTAALHRTHFDVRAAVQVSSVAEASEALHALAEGRPHPAVSTGRDSTTASPAPGSQPKIAFVFSGQGAQWLGMGRELLERESVFRAALERCEEALRRHADWSLVDELTADAERSRLAHTEVVQPLLFALQVALTELWASWGVRPDAVVGHSSGEVAAAHVAGVLDLEEATRVIFHRGRLMQGATGLGKMAAVGLSAEEAEAAVQAFDGRLSVAACNAPRSTVLAGEAAALEEVLARLREQEVFCRPLRVDYAFHSPQMEPFRDELTRTLAGIGTRPARLPVFSTVTGKRAGDDLFDAAYWGRNVREPVRFAPAIDAMVDEGHDVFLEISPHTVLSVAVSECATERGRKVTVLPSLRREQGELTVALGSLGKLYTLGWPVEWEALCPAAGRCVSLPTYPWQRQRYWQESDTQGVEARRRPSGTRRSSLLGTALSLAHAPGHHLFETCLDERWGFLDDHKVQETVILPGTASVELGLSGAEGLYGKGPRTLRSMDYLKALFIPQDAVPTLQILFSPAGADELSFEIRSRDRFSEGEESEPSWTLHVRGKLGGGEGAGPPAPFVTGRREALLARCPKRIPGEEFYALHVARGNHWGDLFQGIEEAWVGKSEAVVRLRVPAELVPQLERFQFHPAVLDACAQALATAMPEGKDGESGFVLGYIDCFRFYDSPRTQTLWVVVVAGVEATPEALTGNVEVFDDDGRPLAVFEGLRLSYLDALEVPARQPRSLDEWLYEVEWPLKTPASPPPSPPDGPGNWLVLTDRGGVGAALCSLLEEHGQSVVRVAAGEAYEVSDSGSYRLDPGDPEQLRRLFAEAAVEAWTGVVYLWSLDAEEAPSESSQTLACGGAALLISTLSAVAQGAAPRLWLVTRGAQPAGPDDGPIAAAQATLWGLGRSVMLEHPELRATLVDLDAAGEADVTPLWREISSPDGEDQVALRGGERRVARLVRHTAAAESAPPTVSPDASYLVTGGLGGLGLVVARWLVEQGARHLVLLGRTALPPRPEWDRRAAEDAGVAEKVAAVLDLEARGAQVELDAVDVADEESLGAFWRELSRPGRPPLRGVVHAAGVIHTQALAELDLEEFRSVQRAKVYGGWLLDRLCADLELDFFVLFSSASALLSSPLLAGYAAGNAFLDALAHDRRRRGQPALSVDWGPWGEVGMAAAQRGGESRNLATRGMATLTSEQGLEALAKLLEEGVTQVGVLPIDWREWSRAYPEASRSPLLTDLVERETAGPPSTVSGRQSLLAAPPEQRGPLAESLLRQQVSQTLGIQAGQLDANQPLTRFGLDSLMAMELKNRVRESLGLDLPLMRWLQGVSLGNLTADVLERLSEATPVSSPTPLLAMAGRAASDPETAEGEFPLSYNQQAMWIEYELDRESWAYNVLLAVRVLSPLDVGALRDAFQELTDRHSILRTTYSKVEGVPRQKVHRVRQVAFEVMDATAWRREQLDARVREEARRPFDLEHGPVQRVVVFACGAREHVFLTVAHHIALDFWSLAILMRELDGLYLTRTPLPALAMDYMDYVRWQQEMLEGPEGERLEAFWRRQMAGGPTPLELPFDRPPVKMPTLQGDTHFFELNRRLTGELRALAEDRQATLFATLLAAFQVLLHRLTGQDDILVSSPMAGRSRSELIPLVGHFVHLVPLRGDLSGAPRFSVLLGRAQQTVLEALEHQEYPALRLARLVVDGRDKGRTSLFDVELALNTAAIDQQGGSNALARPGARWHLAGLEVETLDLPQQAGQFDLGLELFEIGDGFSGFLQYKSDLFDRTTTRRLLGHFHVLLEGLVASPDEKISALPLFTRAERHQLAVELPASAEPVVGGGVADGVYVLDRHLRVVALGCSRRIARPAAGAAGRGGSNGAAQTALRFVPDPFAERPGSRLELTQELGRWRANGQLELFGRGAERPSGEVDRDPEAELDNLFDEVLGELDLGAVEVRA